MKFKIGQLVGESLDFSRINPNDIGIILERGFNCSWDEGKLVYTVYWFRYDRLLDGPKCVHYEWELREFVDER